MTWSDRLPDSFDAWLTTQPEGPEEVASWVEDRHCLKCGRVVEQKIAVWDDRSETSECLECRHETSRWLEDENEEEVDR